MTENQLKVVCRILPPDVPEHVVWHAIDAAIEDPAKVTWRSFVQGKEHTRFASQFQQKELH